MDAALIASLDAAESVEALTGCLARSGDPEPRKSAHHFQAALREPDLAPHRGLWVGVLATTAHPGRGADRLREIAHARREQGTPLDPRCLAALASVLGSSEFLARQLRTRPEWADLLCGDPPPAPAPTAPTADWDAIRSAKYQGLLQIAARDLRGRDFALSPRELSDLADRCLLAGLACAAAGCSTPAPALLALGKLGGRELNFSSDVDLLFVYEPPPDGDPLEQNSRISRLIHTLKREFEKHSPAGFVYRVDLDLRPEGRAGVLANSVDAALSYYESFGAEWERQMLIRLRPLDEDPAAQRFCASIRPFVYRRSIDPRVIHEVRTMKSRIESERSRAGRDLDYELKDGPGGIRDVEFLVQSVQLFAAGRDPELRTGNTLEALALMGHRGLLPAAVAESLRNAYLWLRRAEHALQLADERQTARFPRERDEQRELARRMGYFDLDGGQARDRLLEDWTGARTAVREHFDALVLDEGR